MGGSGGPPDSDPKDVARKLAEAEANVDQHTFNRKLAELLSSVLADYNNRDTVLVRNRIDELIGSLGDLVDNQVATVFGGSVSKHTYIDGLSDIDCLLLLNGDGLDESNPRQILQTVAQRLSAGLDEGVSVTAGEIAVTVTFPDGMEIQLVPAIRSDGYTRIPSSRDPEIWSSINPEKFRRGLTHYNEQCGGNLVPTIKLAKAIIAQLPDAHQLSGYHIESLAIDAFKNYDGTQTPAAMVPHFFKHAKDRVLSPMTDSSGQSVHVDEYMGESGSPARVNASHLLGRIWRRMSSASAAGSIPQWEDLLGREE